MRLTGVFMTQPSSTHPVPLPTALQPPEPAGGGTAKATLRMANCEIVPTSPDGCDVVLLAYLDW